MAKNKFLPAKKGFDFLIDCKCDSINAFNKGENKVFDSKRVGDNCVCVVDNRDIPFAKRKRVKAFRVFVGEKNNG